MRNSSRFLLFFAPLVYLLVAASISALLAFLLHSLIDIQNSFPKAVNRGGLFLILLGIYPTAQLFGLNRHDFGFFSLDKKFLYRVFQGWIIGAIILTVVVFFLLVLDVRIIDLKTSATASSIAFSLGKAFAIGVLVASLEEPLFRGLLLGGLLSQSTKGFALFTSAFYYATLHFLRSNLDFENNQITAFSGFQVIFDSLSQLFNFEIFDSFVALFLSGIFLGLVRMQSKYGLGYCIGIHAGWVFVIKSTKAMTNGNPHSSSAYLVGEYDGIIGCLAAGWLILLIVGLLILFRLKAPSV